jgi:plastocyanin
LKDQRSVRPARVSTESDGESRVKSRPDSIIKSVLHLLARWEIFGIVLFVFAVTFPPLELATEINLSMHMLQHVLIIFAGALIGYSIYRSGALNKIRSATFGLVGFLAVSFLLTYWHFPAMWDAAVSNLSIHVLEHFSFLLAGLLIGSFLPMLPDNSKLYIIFFAMSVHIIYGFALFLSSVPVYVPSSVAQQQVLGAILFAPMPVIMFGYLYLNLTRESRKLDALEGKLRPVRSRRLASGTLLGILALLMISSSVVYFGSTSLAISSANNQVGTKSATVYIAETPVSWQYSPQVLHVVIGVNNTVVWISHSFTVDTVSSVDGLFSSGPISPGQTFSYTFTEPGVYNYYCLYHSWMHGSVIVLTP